MHIMPFNSLPDITSHCKSVGMIQTHDDVYDGSLFTK